MTDRTDDSPRDRVRKVIRSRNETFSVEQVSGLADVEQRIAKDELEQLAERGTLRRVNQGEQQYAPDLTYAYMEYLRQLILTEPRVELRTQVRTRKDEIREIKSALDVDSRTDLEASITDEDVSVTETNERLQILRKWEEIAEDLQALEHALRLYDDVHRFHPDVDGGRSAHPTEY